MPMTKIHSDEYYPFHFVGGPSYATEVDVDEPTLRRWKRVMAQFDEVQEEMRVAKDAAWKAREGR